MKIRNKEDRSNAIWRFIAMTLPVGLLLLLGGFSAGRTFKKFNDDYFNRYYEEAEKVADMEKKMAEQQSAFIAADSVVQVFVDKMETLDNGLTEAAKNNLVTKDVLSKTNSNAFVAFNEFEKNYALLKTKLPPDDAVTTKGFSSFKKYADQHYYRLNHQIDELMKLILQGQEALLSDRIAELDEKQAELEKATEEMGEKAEKTAMQAELKECQNQLKALQTSGSKSFAAEASMIRSKVDAIKTGVIPNMQSKFLGNDKELNKLKTELNGHLDIIMGAANKIE